MSRTKKIVVGSVLGVLLLAAAATAGLTAAGVASAQAPTSTPVAPNGNLNQLFWQSLATRLGTTVEALQQAFKAAAQDAVTQALQQNQITQQQADRLNQRLNNWQPGQAGPFGFPGGKGFGFWGGREMGHGFGFLKGQAVLDAAAKSLGMTTTDLMTELQSGKSLADVAKEKNVDVNTVKQAMVDAAKAQVDQAVTDGKLTQAQADQLKQRIDQLAANLDLSQPFFGHGRMHNEGPFESPWGAPAPETPTPVAPTGQG